MSSKNLIANKMKELNNNKYWKQPTKKEGGDNSSHHHQPPARQLIKNCAGVRCFSSTVSTV
jgi:hypothetical protein